jgi:Bacterial Ig-like domain (group 3)
MAAWFCLGSPRLSFVRIGRTLAQAALLAALVGSLLNSLPTHAQATTPSTTTISGTVYDPRTTNPLPLPNVLVYASTTAVVAPASGVQCLTYQAPTGANIVSYTYTAVDGTFTLPTIPQNASYTVVIQAGKWQRQFPVTVGTSALSGLVLNMPANHNQGNIPMIAIATGNVDGVECVLLHMGIDQAEFADDNTDPTFTNHIHLYQGSYASGAEINASTPSESTLMTNSTTLNGYDMVMFPCQGGATGQATATGATNLANFANSGGRIFATHYSYAWLDPAAPYNSQFVSSSNVGVANWTTANEQQINFGVGTVSTNFSDGATVAQWLQNSGATVASTSNQVDISTLRTDVSSVIPPTQSWVTLNSGSYSGQTGNPVMQMTFNTPVGAPAAGQCGRVMYNDYHVIALTSAEGKVFPAECPSEVSMSAQEELLEYALFDLSTFVQPVVVPTLSLSFNPSPLVVGPNQTGDQLVVNVTNTSATTEIGSSAILTLTLPPLMTVMAMTDSTGGWICTVSTLTCTRNSSIGGGASDPVTLTLSVGSYPAGGLSSYTGQITATVSSVTFSSNVSASDNVIFQQPPAISWATPTPIVYGMPLGAAQLDATSPVAGVFAYTPPAGTVLPVGQNQLSTTLTPNDTTDYTAATASVMLTVVPAIPNVILTASANPVFLSNTVALTATIPSPGIVPGGSVTFYDGSTQIGTVSMSGGSATLNLSTLAGGAHVITAAYSGDSDFKPATSNTITETVEDFTLTVANGGAATVVPAGQAVFTLVVTPMGGATLPAAVNLSAAGTPAGTVATFTPASVAANSASTSVTLNLQMPGSRTARISREPFGRGTLPVSLGLILLPLAALRRARRRLAALVLLAIVGATMLAGIGGCGSASFGPQSFSFPVTAASGPLAHSLTVKLTVEPQPK